MPEITLELSESSIDRAIEELKEYQGKVKALGKRLQEELALEGGIMAAEFAPVDTGRLTSSIEVVDHGDECEVVASVSDVYGHSYAAFVEFGTGVVGEGTYPYELADGYGYNDGFTPSAHEGDGWFFNDPRFGGMATYTEGQAAQPYMAPAAARMRQLEAEKAKEALRW